MKFKVIATGGTIGSETNPDGISTRDVSDRVIDLVIDDRPANKFQNKIIFDISYPMNLLSENIIPTDWIKLAEEIDSACKDGFDAIIVTHGTDSMPYTMAAIALLLPSIKAPVVFTGALSTFDEEDSDAPQNLWDAITFAEHQIEKNKPGVYLVFQGHDRYKSGFAYWGPRVQSIKHGGTHFDTVNNSKIAKIVDGEVTEYKFHFKKYKPHKSLKNYKQARFDERIEVHKIFPGYRPNILKGAIDRGAKAVLLDLYHSGTACSREGKNGRYSLLSVIEELKRNGVGVFGAGASLRTNEQYESLQMLIKAGMTPLGFISLEFAIVKTMYFLGLGFSGNDLDMEMQFNVCNEVFIGTQS